MAVGALAAYASAATLTKITGFSDTLSQTKSRLDLMNDGLQTTAQLQSKIYESAQLSKNGLHGYCPSCFQTWNTCRPFV